MFLVWPTDPCHDECKRMGIKSLGILLVFGSLATALKIQSSHSIDVKRSIQDIESEFIYFNNLLV